MLYSKNKQNTGSALVLGMLVVLIISGLVITYSRVSQAGSQNVEDFAAHQQTFYAAQSGLSRAQHILSGVENDETFVPMAIGESKSFSGRIGDSNYFVTITRKTNVDLTIELPDELPINIDPEDFVIEGGKVKPNCRYSATVKVIGCQFQSGSTLLPITTKVKLGTESIMPFGGFGKTSSDLNNDDGPYEYLIEDVAAGTEFSMKGRSFNTNGSRIMTIDTAAETDNSLVLRDGDTPPRFKPAYDQAEIGVLLADYIDADTGEITLEDNEVIFLMELGSTNPNSSYFDMQDLVMVVSFEKFIDIGSNPDTTGQTPGSTTPGEPGSTTSAIYGAFEVVSTGYVGDLADTEDRNTLVAAIALEENDSFEVVAVVKSKTTATETDIETANVEQALNLE
ncbi:MAG: hypothetical protein V3V74_07015 [Nitrosomonadaceae bacterium]